MADRERSKDRPSGHTPGHHSSNSNPGSLFSLPSLFGRRPAPPATTRQHASDTRSASSSNRHVSGAEGVASPRSTAQQLPSFGTEGDRKEPTPAPFHLDSAIKLMEPGATAMTAELCEIVKATAVWLDSLLSSHEDVFAPEAPPVSPSDLRTLYIRAASFADPKMDYLLRLAAVRLLAALTATVPPVRELLKDRKIHLPDDINLQSIYRLITTRSEPPTPPSAANKVDAIFVEVRALKALTRDGTDIRGLQGIIGWLLRTLGDFKGEWTEWCSRKDDNIQDLVDEGSRKQNQPFAAIRPASPADAVIAIIELLAATVTAQKGLFGPSDITRIGHSLVEYIVLGMGTSASSSENRPAAILPATQRLVTPAPSALNSPATPSLAALAIEPNHRNAGHPSKDPITSYGTPPNKALARYASASVSAVASPRAFTSPALRSPFPRNNLPTPRWTQTVPALNNFCAVLTVHTIVPDDMFNLAIAFICLGLGQDDPDTLSETSWASCQQTLNVLLGKSGSRRGEHTLRDILQAKVKLVSFPGFAKVPDVHRKTVRGAVIAARSVQQNLVEFARTPEGAGIWPFATLVPSLRAACSTSRYPLDGQLADRLKWQPVDYEILELLRDHLSVMQREGSQSIGGTDAWIEGDAACELLLALVPVITAMIDANPQLRTGQPSADMPQLIAIFNAILHEIPDAIGRLHASTSDSPAYYHPKYVDLLLRLSAYLDEDEARVILDFYRRECLCLPFTANWIKNIWKLLQAFLLSSNDLPSARRDLWRMVFVDIYEYAEELPEHRVDLVDRVIVPLLERELENEMEDHCLHDALAVLVKSAVAETEEKMEDRRRVLENQAAHEVEAEEASAVPSQDIRTSTAGGSFEAIRALIVKIATQTACKEIVPGPTAPSSANPFAAIASQASGAISVAAGEARKPASKPNEANSAGAKRGLAGILSPPSRSKEFPLMSSISSPTSPADRATDEQIPSLALSDRQTAMPNAHTDCRSLHAITSLIAIFTRLSFTPRSVFFSSLQPRRSPASYRSIAIYRDLLGLLFPMTDDHSSVPGGVSSKIPARCPKARVVILQWLTRLRADHRHRIYLRTDIDNAVIPYAAILKRTIETEPTRHSEGVFVQRKVSQATRTADTGGTEERGRTARSRDQNSRSRSRSTQPVMSGSTSTYNPLWRIPGPIAFESPDDLQPSESLLTYDPNHPSLRVKDSPPVEGVWLPVSEYVRVLNGILRGHDWELVSYVLTFLPLQLSNKLFFHGRRAVKEVKALLEVLCDGVLGVGPPWEKRFNLPSFIRRADVNLAAYQSLSILIGYRGVLHTTEREHLVRAFMQGLASTAMAKPCIQALTLGIFELEQPIIRNLSQIIEGMAAIVLAPGLAVHILEFLIALGQNGNLFRNFTDEQYRRVFIVATDYIGEHNRRTDETDFSKPGVREAYTLSQHVIGMAYYAIYIWFMALKLHQRPNVVSELTREILKARSQRSGIDEMVEVCFDWLARYTYGNADPKPATSFLADVVMAEEREGEPPKSQSWMLGGAIISITAHARTGWATITTTRATGATAVVCKLENVPLLELGEANADLVSLPAVLMANRHPNGEGIERAETSGLENPAALAQVRSSSSITENFDSSSQHGYIWSGATPSQRRKDVVINPSYLALQLLSSYPSANLQTPRGRLIPNEEKLLRSLRMIQNTPVIDTLKFAVLYVAPKQTSEAEILGNIDGSPLYLDFLSGLGRLIRLKGQVDVFVGGLDRDDDSDGEYAYAWWDDLSQMIFHTPTMMPNDPIGPDHSHKKRLVGNDYVKIVYNDSGHDFAFDTIKTAWNFINIVISPHATGAGTEDLPHLPKGGGGEAINRTEEGWLDWDREEWFKVSLQRAPGIPDFSPIGTHKLISRRALPIVVRQTAHLANDLAARFTFIKDAGDAASAEYITSWRSRLRAMQRLRDSLPPVEMPNESDEAEREQVVRDFTRSFSERPTTTPAPSASKKGAT